MERAWRMRLLLIRLDWSHSMGTTSTAMPWRSPRRTRSWQSPLRLVPNRKFSPTATRRASSCRPNTSCTKASGLRLARSKVKGTRTSWRIPRGSSSSSFSSGRSSRSRVSPWRTSRGWGQKLTTVGTSGAGLGLTAAITRRWPAWRPSKLPSAIAVGPRASEGVWRGITTVASGWWSFALAPMIFPWQV